MIEPQLLAERLSAHQQVYRQLHQLVEEENQALRGPDYDTRFSERRQKILPELHRVLQQLRSDRQQWLALEVGHRRRHPAIAGLLQDSMDLIMKIIVLDRENEQILLRRGMLPANKLPAAQSQQPHYVAQLYQRHHST